MKSVSRRDVILVLGAGVLVGVGLGFLILFGLGDTNLIATISALLVKDNSPSVGRPAPNFELVNLDGETVRLVDLEGKPAIINFWATWCAPCVLEMPNIEKYYEQSGGQLQVVAVNAGEAEFDVRQFSEDIGITFDVLLDPDSEIQERYQIRGYPTSFFLDENGIVRIQHIGMLTESQLEGYLEQLGVKF